LLSDEETKSMGDGTMMGDWNAFFKPAAITRAELAQIVYRYKNLEQTTPNEAAFTDIQGHWAENIISSVQAAGIMTGYDDGSFHPDQAVTHEEGVEVINLLFSRPMLDQPKSPWQDVHGNPWAIRNIESVSNG
jgi:hypothetical protein